MNDKTKRIIGYSMAGFVFVLFIVATFFDLQLSKSLADLTSGQYYSDNVFARFFETVGEMPLYLFTGFALGICMYVADYIDKDGLRKLIKIAIGVSMLAVFYYMWHKFIKYLAQHFNFTDLINGNYIDEVCYFLLGAISGIITLICVNRISEKSIKNFFVFAVIIICTAVISQLLIQGVKFVAGRARYRTLNVIGNFDLYTPWFKFNGHRSVPDIQLVMGIADDGYKSFPSGHTSGAMFFVTLTVLPVLFENLNKKGFKIAFNILGFAFPVVVAITRVVVGAHYFTDVIFGGGITYVVFWIVKSIVLKNINGKLFKLPILKPKAKIVEE